MPEDSEKSGNEPNLELPSLFGRGRKKKRQGAAESETPAAEVPTEEPGSPVEDPVAAPDQGTATAPPPPRPGPAPVEGSTRRLPPTPPPASRPDVEETTPIRATAPPVDPDVEPIPDPAPVPPAPPPAPEPTPEPSPIPEPTPVSEPTPVPEPEPHPGPEFVEQTTVLPGPVTDGPPPVDQDEPVGPPPSADQAETPRKQRALPPIDPRLAVVITGLVVGFAGVLLAWGAGQGCESVRGVGSCGGIGLFALLAVVALQVVVGAALLKAWQITDPTSTSFLAVGMVAVIALLFFLGSLESIWMLVVIPVLTAITFLISWWVTVTFVEQGAGDSLHR